MVAVAGIGQVERVVVVVEWCPMGKLEVVLDIWWCCRSGGRAVNVGIQVLEDVVRKVKRHDVAIAARSRDANLGVAVCG